MDLAEHHDKQLVTLRVPRTLVDAVRQIAERDAETQSSIIRRLIRQGLGVERRSGGQ